MEKEVSASYEASKTNESCMLFNKSEDYSIMVFISIAAIIGLICFYISGYFECIPYCIATVICCFILIYIMHKCKRYRINRFIENNKSNFIYRIDGSIYEFACESQKEYYQLKNKEYDFIVLTNQFSVNENGVAYVIRDKSTLSDPDAKIYIDKNVQEIIRIYYDQIMDLKTGKILHPIELKQFLYEENEMEKKKENDRVTSGQVQVPQIPEMELIKEDYHPIKFIIEEVKSIYKKRRHEEIIDLSDSHILSIEEIKSHVYKNVKEGEK